MSNANDDFNFHMYSLKFVSIATVLLFLIGFTLLNYDNNYNLKVGLADSQKHNHNNTNFNIINPDESAISSYKGRIAKINKQHQNGSIIDNGRVDESSSSSSSKLVILTFGDTIKSQVTTAKSILDQYGFKASFFITCGFPVDSSKNGVQRNIGMPRK